jgi:hypothetical protein
MSDLGTDFDASTGDTIQGMEPMPKGVYPMNAIESKVTITKDGRGSFLDFIFAVTDGPHKGRRIYQNMTWRNDNPKAVEIGHRQFRTFCQSIGMLTVKNTAETHGMFFWAAVGFEKQNAEEKASGFDLKNEIKNFHAGADYHLLPDGSVVKAGAVPGAAAGAAKWTPPVAAAPAAAAATSGAKWTPPVAAAPAAAPAVDPAAAAIAAAVAAARAEDAAAAAAAAAAPVADPAAPTGPSWQQ